MRTTKKTVETTVCEISGPGENPLEALSVRFTRAVLKSLQVGRLDASVVDRMLRCDVFGEGGLLGSRRYGGDDEGTPRDRLKKAIANFFKRYPERPAAAPVGAEAVVRENLESIATILEFDAHDREVFTFAVTLHSSPAFKELLEAFGPATLGAIAGLVAVSTGISTGAAQRVLREGRPVQSGMIVLGRDDTSDAPQRLGLKDGVLDLSFTPGLTRDSLIRMFLPKEPASTLHAGDFDTLRAEVDTLRALLDGAMRKGARGVNVLLYGPTGTGKTELARLLAAELGVALHSAAAEDHDGDSVRPEGRLSSMVLGQKLLAGSGSILLFDELEDIFKSDGDNGWLRPVYTGYRRGRMRTAGMSKAWFNHVLETNPVPTIWISNEVHEVDPAFLRRFSFAVEFRPQSATQRARILARHLEPGDTLSPADVGALTRRHAVPAAVLQRALASARIASPEGRAEAAAVEQLIQPISSLLNGSRAGSALEFDPTSYSLEAVNTPVNLEDLAARLATWKPGERPGVTLCLYGPPGTGKSEFVKYLAQRMGREVLYRRVSDIQSMWVGETEKAIAAAFRQAESEGAVLLFDEADSFLRDRRSARNSWEVTQVNEFLQRLECYRGIVACTTNLVDNLDEASLRRFVFKVPFRYLRAEQSARLFGRVFGPFLETPVDAATRAALEPAMVRIGELAPGDFAAVARRLAVFDTRTTVEACLEALREEIATRQRRHRGVVGFATTN